ncbi:sodium:solute symporter [Fulvivirgaceae bacterium BMA12]|uniref:Sodium:solute symporter n=1 Tax=Agaribacillus aureus TaxID=3051825 RepID=A0ABT8LJC5_9BACT|nr:sodium:solute symporter [Fulvivirgaceae bacterium BMA12]
MFGIVALGIFSTRKQQLTSDNYFLAGRGLSWPTIGAALFASNISTIHLTGLAADGYRLGLVAGNWEWMATFTLILLGIVFAPFYIKTKISTLPEFLERRFDSRSRTFLAFMGIVGALFIHIGISIYAGAIVFQKFFGVNVYVSILVVSLMTTIYTVFGGLKAVVITENVQTIILLLGSTILTTIAVLAVRDLGVNNWSELNSILKPGQLEMLHTKDSEIGGSEGYTWYAFFLGYPVLGIWYWCTDQTIVQRVLGAKTQLDAQRGALFAGLLKILPVFILILPGVLAFALFEEDINHPNETLPVLINQLLPIGLKGIFAAALLAALMSTVAAALNGCSSLVAVDIIKRINPNVSDSLQVKYGRITAVVVMVISILWSTQGGKFGSIFQAINDIAGAIAPPISAVFLLGVFYKRGTKEAAFYTLVSGFILGVVVFLLDFEPVSGYKYITKGLGIHFLMRGWWVFCISMVLFVAISQLTAAPDQRQIKETTWVDPRAVIEGSLRSIFDIRLLAGFLLLLMVILYFIFG